MGLMDLLTGAVGSKDEDAKAKKYLDQTTGAFDGLTAPDLKPVDLQKYGWMQDLDPTQVNQGADVQYTPAEVERAQAQKQADSQMGGISDDPRLKDSQMSSLAALKDLADHGGMNLSDKANLNKIESQVAQQDKGRQDAIKQNMAERGAGGSGQELLARLSSSQAATDRASQSSQDIAGQAQQRALQAMLQGGQLSGQMRAQDFDEASKKAAAQDAINNFNAVNGTRVSEFNANSGNGMNQFNAGNTLHNAQQNRATDLGVQTHNADATTNADKFNIEGRQGLANAGVDIGNRQTMYNAGLPQQDFQNKYQIAGGKASAGKAGVDYYGKQSDKSRQGVFDGVNGLGQIGAAAYSKYGSKAGSAAGGGGGGDSSPTDTETSMNTGGENYSGGDMGGGDMGGGAMYGAHGGFVPGRAHVHGDSLLNDTVHARLSPGEVVVDRDSIAHAPKAARSFLNKMGDHPLTPGPVTPDKLGDFLHSLNPKKSMHDDSEFSIGQKSYKPDSGDSSSDLDETLAKLAALGLLSKQGA